MEMNKKRLIRCKPRHVSDDSEEIPTERTYLYNIYLLFVYNAIMSIYV